MPWVGATALHYLRCFDYWWGDKQNTWPVNTCITYSQSGQKSLEKLADPDSPGKNGHQQVVVVQRKEQHTITSNRITESTLQQHKRSNLLVLAGATLGLGSG